MPGGRGIVTPLRTALNVPRSALHANECWAPVREPWTGRTAVLDLKYVRDNVELVRERLAARGATPSILDEFVQLDAERRAILAEVESLRQRRNELSKEVAELKRQGQSTGDVIA